VIEIMHNSVLIGPGLQQILMSVLPLRAWETGVEGGISYAGLRPGKDGTPTPAQITVLLKNTAIQADQDLVTSILGVYKSLPVQTDKATITADNADTATITCNDASFAGDTDLGFYVTADGRNYGAGDVPVVGGVITLTLATDVAGIYVIEVWRKTGNYAHGFILVTAE